MIAAKMADILLQEGEEVLKVIMIDSANPEFLPAIEMEEQNTMAELILARNLGSRVPPASSGYDSEPSSDSDTETGSLEMDRQLRKMRAHISLGLKLMSTVAPGVFLSGYCDTHVVLVKCEAEEYLRDGQFGNKGAGVRKLMRDRTMNWDLKKFREFETVGFGAAHDTAFDSEFVGELTGILKQLLAEVE
jgi:hypothetical protein